MKRLISFDIILLFFITCLFAKAPKWIIEPYSKYPMDNYFVGIGEDKKKNDSEIAAVKEVANIFGQDIESFTDANKSFSEFVDKDISSNIEKRAFNQKIEVLVDQKNLIGIKIVESYFDEKNKIWYTLAVLDRKESSDLYKTLIEKNEKIIKETEKNLSHDNLFIDYAYLDYICNVISANNFYLQRLFVVDDKTAFSLSKQLSSETKYVEKKNEIVSKMPINIIVTNDIDNIISSSLKEAFTKNGFKVGKNNDCRYVLNVCNTADTNQTTDNKNILFYNYSVSMEMKDLKTNEVLFSSLITGRDGASTLSKAIKKVKFSFEKKIPKEFINSLEEYKKSIISAS